MGEGAVDKLQIEIASSSTEAVKQLDALTDSLNRLRDATNGKFGDVQRQISDIAESESLDTKRRASQRVQEKKAALDRATSTGDDSSIIKAGNQLNKLDSQIAKAKANIKDLEQAVFAMGMARNKSALTKDIEQANKRLEEQKILLEALTRERERQEGILRGGGTPKETRSPEEAFASLKERLAGTQLSDLLGDVGNIDEATAKMEGLNDQVKVLQLRLEALHDKLQSAFEAGNLSQVASYTSQIQSVQNSIERIMEAQKTWDDVKSELSGSTLGGIVGDAGSVDEAIGKITSLEDNVSVLKIKLEALQGKLADAFSKGNMSQVASYTQQIQKIQEQLETLGKSWDDVKAGFAGTSLGNILDGTNSVGEAVEKMSALGDQTTVLQLKLEALKGKLAAAFTSGNLSQIASYTEQIRRLQEKIAELQRTPTQGPKPEEPEEDQVESEGSLNRKLSILEKIKKVLSDIKMLSLAKKGDDGISGTMGSIKEIMGGVPGAVDSISNSLSGLSAQSGNIKNLTGSLGGLSSGIKELASSHPYLAAAVAAIAALGAVVGTAFREMGKLGKSAASLAKSGFSALSSAAKKLGDALKGAVSQGIEKVKSGLKNIGNLVISDVTKPIRTVINAVSSLRKSLGRVIFLRAIRSTIGAVTRGLKDGIDNLYQYSSIMSTQFAPAMDRLATSALYLKNSFAAMVSPLIEAVAPVIDMIVDKIASAMNLIGKFFAALTGKKTFTQAVRVQKQYAQAATGAANASDKAKKATDDYAKAIENFSLGIDELNIIEPPDVGSNLKDTLDDLGNGAGGIDYGSMFEEVEIPVETLDWVNQIREAIEKGDWYSVGEIVATKLNEVVEDWDARGWGETLGGAITNGLNVALGFLENFNFDKFGGKIADWFNGLADGIDWETLGNVIAAKYNALFNFVYGFAKGLNWAGIGTDIATALNGFLDKLDPEKAAAAVNTFILGIFTALDNIITGTSWDVLGAKLATALNSIQWYEIVAGALNTAIDSINALKTLTDAFLENWEWEDMADDISKAVNDSLKKVDAEGWGETLGNAAKTALSVMSGLLEKIQWKEIGSKIGSFLIGLDWVGVLSGLADVIVNGINAAVATLSGFLDRILPHLKTWADNLADKLDEVVEKINWEDLGETLNAGINAALNFLLEFMDRAKENGTFQKIGEKIGSALEKIEWDKILGKVGELIGEVLNAKMELIDVSGILEVGGNIVKGLWNGIWEEFKASGGIVGWVKRNIFDLFMKAIKGLFGIHSPSTVMRDEVGVNITSGLLAGISKGWKDITTFLSGKIDGIKKAFSDAWTEVKTNASTKWNEIKTTVGGIWDNLKTDAGRIFGDIKDRVIGAWSESETSSKTSWGNISTSVIGFWSNMATSARNKFTSIKDSVLDAWKKSDEDSNKKWGTAGTIRSTVTKTWGFMRDEAVGKFTEIKENVLKAWSESETDSNLKWGTSGTIVTAVGTAWGNMATDVGTKFTTIKDAILTAWKNADDDSTAKWGDDGTISTTVSGSWNKLHEGAEDKFPKIKDAITDAWGKSEEDTNEKWGEKGTISSVSGTWDTLAQNAGTSFGSIFTSVTTAWGGIYQSTVDSWGGVETAINGVINRVTTAITGTVNAAKKWGEDIGKGISSGINNAKSAIEGAASGAAEGIDIYLGFSEPEKGPLSDFHTYMPDMIDLMTSGIKDNSYKVTNAVKDVASSMSGVLSNVNVEAPKFAGVKAPNISVSQPSNDWVIQNARYNQREEQSDGNEKLIAAFYAAAGMIVDAINSQDGSVYIDGKQLMQTVERQQRQRGVNIMAGGGL